ncbi:hypothetical protein ABFX02_13G013800 [Erythranthe guttata]
MEENGSTEHCSPSVQVNLPKRSIITRPGFGNSGERISLLANYFKVSVENPDTFFYKYSVVITSEDNTAVDMNVLGRETINELLQTYTSDLAEKRFAYDGEASVYTVGPLPQNNFEFVVVLEESIPKRQNPSEDGIENEPYKRSKSSLQSKTFKVEISYVAKVALNSISESEKNQDALRVLDIVLRQEADKRGMFLEIGEGLMGVRAFDSNFCPTLGGLCLNMDVSANVIFEPGPMVDFLLANQKVNETRDIDWGKAKKMLKNMRIMANHSRAEFEVIGLSEKPCNQQLFSPGDDEESVEITVYDHFVKRRNIELVYSSNMPCLDVGKPTRPNYLPIELCLVSVQPYTKVLSRNQRASLVEKLKQNPPDIIQAMKCNYVEDHTLFDCGISIEKNLTQINGRILDTPKLKVGNNEDCIPKNGRWNFNNKKLLKPSQINLWAVVNFSERSDCSQIARELIKCGREKGINIERPHTIFEEDPKCRRATSPVKRVEMMFKQIIDELPNRPDFLLCVLPEKECDIYGPWKKKCICGLGIVTQCISPTKIDDQYLTDVLLKINSKLGGINSLLEIEHSRQIPLVSDKPTMILGIDILHSGSNVPSIAAVVGSRSWPMISRYRAAVRSQSSKVEMIESLFKPLANGEDGGIMRELLLDFYETANERKPTQIIVFRGGVSESQFSQVLNIELDQIIKAYKHLGRSHEIPKFTVIVAGKNHHTKLFQDSDAENIPCGTVVDTNIVHPTNYDFYMCSQADTVGNSEPVHYHVLLDEIGFSPNDLQNLVHSLCYVNQRSTTCTTTVAPVFYARLAAEQMSELTNFEEYSSETSSGEKSVNVAELPRLHKDVAGSMFFC